MKILSIKDSIITIAGQKGHFIGQIIVFDKKVIGNVIKTTTTKTFVIVDDSSKIKMTSKYTIKKEDWAVKADDSMMGKIIDVFGNTLYIDVPETKSKKKFPIKSLDTKAPNFSLREKLETPLETGIFTIDSLIPIGRGQRELIIGDRKTGKTSIALSTIINQKDKGVRCIYVSIGQKQTSINNTYTILKENDALSYTTIIAASPELKLSQYLAPYLGMAYAESFAAKGEDVLIVFDDLSKHANIYRELSLNIDKPGGREAYPSDLFYSHSKLLERSGKFVDALGGGSITALPIAETIEGDFATLLATNIISITDGQIITDASIAKENIFPAINISLSVSRTGSAVQNKLMKQVGKNILKIYTRYMEAKKYELISMEVSKGVKSSIEQGKSLLNAFEQYGFSGRTDKQMYLMAKIVEWNIISSESEFDLSSLMKFALKDKTGSILMHEFEKNLNFDNTILQSYFKSLTGQENELNAKKSALEVKGVING